MFKSSEIGATVIRAIVRSIATSETSPTNSTIVPRLGSTCAWGELGETIGLKVRSSVTLHPSNRPATSACASVRFKSPGSAARGASVITRRSTLIPRLGDPRQPGRADLEPSRRAVDDSVVDDVAVETGKEHRGAVDKRERVEVARD